MLVLEEGESGCRPKIEVEDKSLARKKIKTPSSAMKLQYFAIYFSAMVAPRLLCLCGSLTNQRAQHHHHVLGPDETRVEDQ